MCKDKDCAEMRADMKDLKIKKVVGREIIDSRGNPTVEAEVHLSLIHI